MTSRSTACCQTSRCPPLLRLVCLCTCRDARQSRQRRELAHGQQPTRGRPAVKGAVHWLQDCTRLFGSPRSSKYVAQDSIELLPEGDSRPPRVVHRALANFMRGWSPSLRRFLATRALLYEYPLDAAELDSAQPCGEDATPLLHEEPRPSGGPDSRHAAVKVGFLR